MTGRPRFTPTAEQRSMVEAMMGFGILEVDICRLIKNPQTGKPIDEKTLRRAFPAEIANGKIKVEASVGNFIVASIVGREGGIKDERARSNLAMFFAKTRMGWRETVVNEHANKDGNPFIIHISDDDAKL